MRLLKKIKEYILAIIYTFFLSFLLLSLDGCELFQNHITVKTDKKEVLYGEFVTINWKYYGWKFGEDSKVTIYAQINGEEIELKEEYYYKEKYRYHIQTTDDITFFVRICNHYGEHGPEENRKKDLFSNKITVKNKSIPKELNTINEYFNMFNSNVYEYNSHYYTIVSQAKTWPEAETACEIIGGHLAVITSAEENSFIYRLVEKERASLSGTSSIFIGGRKENNKWQWASSEEFDYTCWANGEPNGSGIYAAIWNNKDDKNFRWDDVSAQTKYYFVCEWDSKENMGYANLNGIYFDEIKTVNDLLKLNNSSQNYVLMNDIDLSNYDNWTPITNFNGILLGDGHSILNLKINALNQEKIGLFDVVNNTIRNLKIENAHIKAVANAKYIGILAGTNNGKIENVTVSGTLDAPYYDYVGGIVGYNNKNKSIGCINNANITGNKYVGGIDGYAYVNGNEQISGNINNGKITGTESVGGIAGYVTCPDFGGTTKYTFTISNNKNQNEIKGSTKVGGIFGTIIAQQNWYYSSSYDNYFEINLGTNSYDSDIVGQGDYVGGIIGYSTRVSLLTACENHSNISGRNYVGGIVGYSPSTNIKANNFINESTISGGAYVGGIAGCAGIIENAINSGEILSNGIISETNIGVASYVGGIAGYSRGVISCTNNSDITVNVEAKYVGGIAGYIYVNGNEQISGNTNKGKIIGNESVGGIAGYVTCPDFGRLDEHTFTISNNKNQAEIQGSTQIGGIFGTIIARQNWYYSSSSNNYFEITLAINSYDSNIIGQGDYVGGIIGYSTRVKLLTACENHSDVFGRNYVGGIAGYAPNTNIKANNFSNENTISGNAYVGGVAGYAGIIENAINNGEILSNGSLSEKDVGAVSYVGGIAGYSRGVINCTNNSDITVNVEAKYVGGIAGYVSVNGNEQISGNINNGKITGYESVGGIAGYVTCPDFGGTTKYTFKISNNKNQNDIVGSTKVGGIFGTIIAQQNWYYYSSYDNYFEVTSCSNYGNITGNSYVGGIAGSYTRLKTDSVYMDTNTSTYDPKLG